MGKIVSEKEYPIQKIWLVKPLFALVPFMLTFSLIFLYIIGVMFNVRSDGTSVKYFPFITVGVLFFVLFSAILRRLTFHYLFEDKVITLRQGILSKQQRQLPYGVIQNILIRQDVFDRLFNLSSLSFENVSTQILTESDYRKVKAWIGDLMGFRASRVDIPGLSKADAENLKSLILEKIKENPIEDSQSGL